MVANDCMLQVVGERIEFWREQLQAAFRGGDDERVAECTRVIEEYAQLMAEAIKNRATAFDPADIDHND